MSSSVKRPERTVRLAITSDLHHDRRGYLTSPAELRTFVAELRATRPDLVVLGGDLGHPIAEFEACLDCFTELSVPVGVVAGNHDVWTDPDGPNSRELWETRLRSAVVSRGFFWLESESIRVGSLAVCGSMVWYDYSAASPELGLSVEQLVEAKSRLSGDYGRIDWEWSDVELADRLRHGLIARLRTLQADPAVSRIVLVTHVPLFDDQLVRRPGDRRWSISNAYFGNLTTGRDVLGVGKVSHVISGHTHTARHARIERPQAPALDAQVVGSDYGAPACIVLDIEV